MREIDQLDDAVDHRIAEGDDRIDAAKREAVDDLLQENIHAACLAVATRKRHPQVPFLFERSRSDHYFLSVAAGAGAAALT